MTKHELKEIFRSVVFEEFENIPVKDEKRESIFSKNFIKKMDKLIASTKKKSWRFINTAYKKVAIIVLILSLLFTSSLSIEAVRTPDFDFVVRIYETCRQYIFPDNDQNVTRITYQYQFENVPDGFFEVSSIKYDMVIESIYEDESGNTLYLTQSIAEKSDYSLDNERGTVCSYGINGHKTDIYISESDRVMVAIWVENGYLLEVFYDNLIDINDFKEIIQLIQ